MEEQSGIGVHKPLSLQSTHCDGFITRGTVVRKSCGDGRVATDYRRRILLGVASHGPTHRRSGCDGRFAVYWSKGSTPYPAQMTEQPCLGIALLSSMEEGDRKGSVKKACSRSSCWPTTVNWISNLWSQQNKAELLPYEACLLERAHSSRCARTS